MLVCVGLSLALVLSPLGPRQQPCNSHRHSPIVKQIRESRVAPIKEISPGARYRKMKADGKKFYNGRKPDARKDLKEQLENVGQRKVVIITGASSGLGFFCVESLLQDHATDYFVIAAVREPEKMLAAAEKSGINRKDYAVAELELASLQSVKDLAEDLKESLPGGKLDRLVCNAAVYLPTDPVPRFTDDGYEMSLQVNHLGHQILQHRQAQGGLRRRPRVEASR